MTKYSHIALGTGRATLAIRADERDLEVAVALCSPKDQFCKAKGRKIATGRMEVKGRYYMKVARNPEEKPKEQAQRVIRSAVRGVKHPNIPKWAAAKVAYPANPAKPALIVSVG